RPVVQEEVLPLLTGAEVLPHEEVGAAVVVEIPDGALPEAGEAGKGGAEEVVLERDLRGGGHRNQPGTEQQEPRKRKRADAVLDHGSEGDGERKGGRSPMMPRPADGGKPLTIVRALRPPFHPPPDARIVSPNQRQLAPRRGARGSGNGWSARVRCASAC